MSLFCKSQLWFQIWYIVVVKLIYMWPFLQISLCSLKKSVWILWQRPFSLCCSHLLSVIEEGFCFHSSRNIFFASWFLVHHILLFSLLSQYNCLLLDLEGGLVEIVGFLVASILQYCVPIFFLFILARHMYFIVTQCLICSNVKIYEIHVFYTKLFPKAKIYSLYSVMLYVFDFIVF